MKIVRTGTYELEIDLSRGVIYLNDPHCTLRVQGLKFTGPCVNIDSKMIDMVDITVTGSGDAMVAIYEKPSRMQPL